MVHNKGAMEYIQIMQKPFAVNAVSLCLRDNLFLALPSSIRTLLLYHKHVEHTVPILICCNLFEYT